MSPHHCIFLSLLDGRNPIYLLLLARSPEARRNLDRQVRTCRVAGSRVAQSVRCYRYLNKGWKATKRFVTYACMHVCLYAVPLSMYGSSGHTEDSGGTKSYYSSQIPFALTTTYICRYPSSCRRNVLQPFPPSNDVQAMPCHPPNASCLCEDCSIELYCMHAIQRSIVLCHHICLE